MMVEGMKMHQVFLFLNQLSEECMLKNEEKKLFFFFFGQNI